MSNVIAYYRVSTDRQRRSGLSHVSDSQSGRGLIRQDQKTEVPFALPRLGASLRQPAALGESPGRPRPPKTLDPPHLDQQIRITIGRVVLGGIEHLPQKQAAPRRHPTGIVGVGPIGAHPGSMTQSDSPGVLRGLAGPRPRQPPGWRPKTRLGWPATPGWP